MKPFEIYSKTLKFVWMKLGLGLLTFLLSTMLLGLCVGMGMLFRSELAFIVLFLVWVGGSGTIHSVLMSYFGYLVKAGHVAIVATAIKEGAVPDNCFEVAKDKVQKKFVTSNVYFVVDRLVGHAVKQLQSGVDQVDQLLGNIPGISALLSFAKLFIGIALGYVDECCLGYTFYNDDQKVFKSAADGVVIYFQNWKTILKNGVMLSLKVIISVAVMTVAVFAVLGSLFAVLGWNGFLAFVLSIFMALILKTAFVDSYIMISMMVKYLEVAPKTEISFDLYSKLCKLSRKFKELFDKGNAEEVAA